MAIATTVQFWTSRLNGDNPESPSDASTNEAWTKTGAGSAAASGGHGGLVITSIRLFQQVVTTHFWLA